MIAALEAGETATFSDRGDPHTLASVTVTPECLTLQLDDAVTTFSMPPEDRRALADAIRATHLSPCEFVS